MQINQLVKTLLQKETLEQCSLQELQTFADSNPHFGAAQLLLTKKIKTEKPELYNEQLQRTFLYFHNPLWVEKLMNDTGHATIIAAPPTADDTHRNDFKDVAIKPEVGGQKSEVESKIPETIIDNSLTESITAAETPELQNLELKPEPSETTELQSPNSELKTPNSELRIENSEIPGLAATALQLTSQPASTDLSFEPYHTVDYFASQGIKLKTEEKPADKFGQQLKSFTDWLKVLRKTPATDITKNIAAKAEQKVEQMAEHSLHEKEIVTEAMAEVWAKQGYNQKAIEIYQKLSLQEPLKSTYFASLIDALKK